MNKSKVLTASLFDFVSASAVFGCLKKSGSNVGLRVDVRFYKLKVLKTVRLYFGVLYDRTRKVSQDMSLLLFSFSDELNSTEE